MNQKLRDALRDLSQNDTLVTREMFYRELLTSVLILPLADSTGDGTLERRTLTQGSALSLKAFENSDGTSLLLAFSDEEAVLAWQPQGTPYVAMHAPDLFEIVHQQAVNNVIINPAGPVKGQLTREEIEILSQNRPPDIQAPPAQSENAAMTVLIGKPHEQPTNAQLQTLRKTLAKFYQINAAYLFELHLKTQASQLVVGVHFEHSSDKAERDASMKALLATLRQDMDADTALQFIILEDNDFLRTVKDTVAPLYLQE